MAENKIKEPDEILESAPPGTPPVFLGLAFITTAFLSSFLAVYVALSPDIKEWIGWKQSEAELQMEMDKEIYTTNSQSVLGIVAAYTTQVSELSKAVGALTKEKADIEFRLKSVEADLFRLKGSLEECTALLDKCQTEHEKHHK